MNSDRRPADTVAKLADYLWWLLPNFLKRRDRSRSLVARLCDVWGEELGEGRTTLVEIIPLLLVETATGAWLDQLARARQIFRGEGESDESLRTRVLAAHEIKRKGGTIPGMMNGLAAIGYGVAVEEPNKGTDKWSRFVVKVFTWNGVVADQKVVVVKGLLRSNSGFGRNRGAAVARHFGVMAEAASVRAEMRV